MIFFGSLFFSYFFSAVDVEAEVVVITEIAVITISILNLPNSLLNKKMERRCLIMPENRGGCGFGLNDDCIWIIVLILLIFCCCGNGNRGCC